MQPLPRFSGYFAFKPPSREQSPAEYHRFFEAFMDLTEPVKNIACQGSEEIFIASPPATLDEAFFSFAKRLGVRMFYQPETPRNFGEYHALEAKARKFFDTLA